MLAEWEATHKTFRRNDSASEIKTRKAEWKAPKAPYKMGVLAKYAKLVSSASEGAVTDKDLGL